MSSDFHRMAPPVHIGTLMADALARLHRDGDSVLLNVCRRWDALAGPAIAANTRPVGLKDRLLLVEVFDNVWMQQLQFLKAELIARINDGLPEPWIEKIRFKIATP